VHGTDESIEPSTDHAHTKFSIITVKEIFLFKLLNNRFDQIFHNILFAACHPGSPLAMSKVSQVSAM